MEPRKENTVKRIFFKEGIYHPFFEMVDGSLKEPVKFYGEPCWVTQKERQAQREKDNVKKEVDAIINKRRNILAMTLKEFKALEVMKQRNLANHRKRKKRQAPSMLGWCLEVNSPFKLVANDDRKQLNWDGVKRATIEKILWNVSK